jgi:quercetin dioxygenase-like cupin family protein
MHRAELNKSRRISEELASEKSLSDVPVRRYSNLFNRRSGSLPFRDLHDQKAKQQKMEESTAAHVEETPGKSFITTMLKHLTTVRLRRDSAMKRKILLLVVAMSFAFSTTIATQEAHGIVHYSPTADSKQTNASDLSNIQFTIVNLSQLIEENPIDPKVDFLIRDAAFGKNCSIDVTQAMPGSHYPAHYHSCHDEIDYVIQGRANMTVDGKNYSIKPGDLIYIPPFTVHDFVVVGDETYQVIVIFAPPFDGKDRTYV